MIVKVYLHSSAESFRSAGVMEDLTEAQLETFIYTALEAAETLEVLFEIDGEGRAAIVGVNGKKLSDEPIDPGLNLDWPKALKRLNDVTGRYTSLIGQPGVNPYFALQHSIGPVKERYLKGERTKELYDEIMALE